MKEYPLVSVIMPAYNSEEFIAESIESILNQSYKNFELIILNDASTDRTLEIAQEFAKKDSRIRLISNPQNLYIAGNRNKGLELAKGKYIVWQDADDISLPDRILKEVEYMEEHPDVGICGGFIQSFDRSGDLDLRTYSTDDRSLRESIFKFSPVAQPSAIIRKKAIDEVGMFDLDTPPAEDIDLSFRIGTKYKFANIPEVLIRYREHPNSATHKKLKKQIQATLEARKKYSKGKGYTMRPSDHVAYYITYIMQFLPANLTIILFKIARGIVRTF